MTSARLQKIPDVGKTSAQVITRGDGAAACPSISASLEAAEPVAVSRAASELLDRLRGDCHSHSDWSDGGSPIREMAEAAREYGHQYWALTDHSPRLTVAHGLDADRLRRQLDIVAELNDELAPFRILTGIEVDILDDGALDQDESLLAHLDVVVASVHSKLRMEEPEMTRRMLRAVESPHTDILGHCTGRIVAGKGRPPSTFDAEAVFGGCARPPAPPSRSTPGPSASTRPSRCWNWPCPWAVWWWSTPMPTPRDSSSGSATAANRRLGWACPRTGS